MCLQVSGNHRLDDNKAERERILAAGAEVAQSEVRRSFALCCKKTDVPESEPVACRQVPVYCPEGDRVGEVAWAQVEGKGVGPLRVWPGGLAMGRTLGDHAGGVPVLCEPEVRQVPASPHADEQPSAVPAAAAPPGGLRRGG